MKRLEVPTWVIEQTIHHLVVAGKEGRECVVLWLGRSDDILETIVQVVRPEQEARENRFVIPPESMKHVLSILGELNLMIIAQVHSHPHEAFHSAADDHWAIVRHVGALSLVVPNFALSTSVEEFPHSTKVYTLDSMNNWTELGPDVGIKRIKFV